VAFTINIPGLVRLIIAWQPNELLGINDASMVTRPLSGRGGLVNSSIAGKLAVFRSPDGDIWPAFRDRRDPSRATHQAALEAALSDVEPLLQRIAPEIAALGSYVAGAPTDRNMGVIVQQAVGRLFFADYTATEDSYRAARKLQAWLAAGPLRAFLIRRSGALEAARDQIEKLSRGNMACAHATALAMDNIVRSVDLMRMMEREGGNLATITPEVASAQTLRAPARVVREAQDEAYIGSIRIRSRTLVLLMLDHARRQRPADPGFAFFAGAWNQCPAHGIVPALLIAVWRAAQDRRGTGP
jgi:hypothetical protein